MWYNITADLWQNDGCDTIINDENNKILCSCSHLTTFAMIRSIHMECDGNMMIHYFVNLLGLY